MTFEERLLKHGNKLNDTDDSIIEYIKSHRSEVTSMSIQDLASSLYIVPNAIMRFAKKLEYSGFSQLKFSLSEEEHKVEQVVGTSIPNNVIKTLEVIDYDNLLAVSTLMKKCRRILFVGVGDSVSYCEMMVRHVRCLDKSAEYYLSYHDIDFQTTHAETNDLIFFISASGENERLINIAKAAKKRGVSTVCTTHFSSNGLSQSVDIPLYFYGEARKVNGYNVNDRTGLMILLRELSEVFWRNYCV